VATALSQHQSSQQVKHCSFSPPSIPPTSTLLLLLLQPLLGRKHGLRLPILRSPLTISPLPWR